MMLSSTNNNRVMKMEDDAEEEEEECMTGLSLALAGTVVPNKKKNKPLMVSLHQKKFCSTHQRIDDDGGHHHHHHNNKKLRLTKEQSTMLENSFNQHTTLNSAQKKSLAEELNLKTRQIEVWFQNRRARTKLKQTEVDCELLKKRCQSLTDENRRLKKELEEVTAALEATTTTSPPSLYIQHSKASPATTLTMCSSCHKLLLPNSN
ncbi:homeobox-leucine zipper protein HOX1-like [Arachis hypogaea]|uniref:Homeobox domain-containing protein n=1 Tax=Arachis hypogaea TaxID=3818 RepID=A0A445ENV2_ARAHY|nr:homeobox-leucine zipper protein HOX1-like [Arachis hypogaea]QHO50235.1 Homeobox-leucine zipper protein [Arachis hypogaea]RYR77129.1 hypothetical protein Ahy_A01g001596 [Arachis hypogaea]